LKHFEPIWGEKHEPATDASPLLLPSPARPSLKTTIKLRPSTSASGRHNKIVPSLIPRRLRTVGAVTRAITSYHRVREEADSTAAKESANAAEKRPAEQTDENDEKEVHKKLKSVNSPPASSVDTCDQDASEPEAEAEMKVDDSLPEEDVTAKPSEEQTLETETEKNVEDSPAEQESETKPNEIKDEMEKETEFESVISEMRVEENKADEQVTPDLVEMNTDADESSAENLKKPDDTKVNTNDEKCSEEVTQDEQHNNVSAVETSGETDKSDSNSDINFEVVKEENECEKAVQEVRCAEELEVSDPKLDYTNEVEESKASESIEQDSSTVQDIVVNNDDDVPEQYVIDESGVLASTDYTQEESLNENSSTKECDSKTVAEASTEVGSMTDHEESKPEEEEEDPEEVQAALLAAAVAGSDGCCWDMVDSTEKFLAEVPVVALEAVPVIPMKEELEVRLEEGTFPVAPEDALSMDWPYAVKMDPAIVAAALEETGDGSPSALKSTQAQYPEYSTSQAVKLELEVTLTPEAVTSADSLVTSTVGGVQNSKTSACTPTTVSKTSVATVIPPTTIVCLPSAVSTPNLINNTQLTSGLSAPSSSNVVTSSLTKTAAVASSSAVPYLALSSNTPVRAIPTQLPKTQSKAKPRDSSQVAQCRGSRASSNKPPPGAVNLERSYQICQAVIQNSPNRDQLRCQLKPPPSLLAANSNTSSSSNKKSENSGSSRAATQYGVVTSSRNGNGPNSSVSAKPFTPPLPAPGSYPVVPAYHQRQQSPPVVVRHVFTSSQGIPVTMAVLPQSQAPPEVAESAGAQLGHVGQYILVQRTGGAPPPPRASSAPPSNNQVSGGGRLGLGRGRPASVDVERSQLVAAASQQQHPQQQGVEAIQSQ
ncbi:hypothetical protein L9F63_004431, partial [Diploptera punctata]